MKAIKRTFHPDEVDTLKFEIKKINSKKYKLLTPQDRLDAISFIEDCEKDLLHFKNELKNNL